MMSWGGMSSVTVRRLTRTRRSTIGMMNIRPGPRASPTTLPKRKRTPRSYSLSMWIDARSSVSSTSAAMTHPARVSIAIRISDLSHHQRQTVHIDHLRPAGREASRFRPDRPPRTVDERVTTFGVPGVDHNLTPDQGRYPGRGRRSPRAPGEPTRPGGRPSDHQSRRPQDRRSYGGSALEQEEPGEDQRDAASSCQNSHAGHEDLPDEEGGGEHQESDPDGRHGQDAQREEPQE